MALYATSVCPWRKWRSAGRGRSPTARSETTPLARQAAALQLARDEVPWLLAEIDRLSEENESLGAQLDDCHERLDMSERR